MVYQRLWFVGCDSGVDDWYIKDWFVGCDSGVDD